MSLPGDCRILGQPGVRVSASLHQQEPGAGRGHRRRVRRQGRRLHPGAPLRPLALQPGTRQVRSIRVLTVDAFS